MVCVVGIDFGIINFVVSVFEGGEFKVIVNVEGFCMIFLVVVFIKDGEVFVGEIVKCQVVINVDWMIVFVKCYMGIDWIFDVDGKKWMLQEIFVCIFMKFKCDVEVYLGDMVIDVVIIVFVYFNDVECQVIKEVGEIVGLNVLCIINELIVVVLVYGFDKGKEDEFILVFDLGGGMFDVLLFEVGKDDDFFMIQVCVMVGDNCFGGDDWDQCLVDYLIKQFKEIMGVDVLGDKIVLQCFKEVVEQVKKEFFFLILMSINLLYFLLIDFGFVLLFEIIICVKFEDFMKDLFDCIKKLFEDVICEVGIKVFEIDYIVFVGGLMCMFVVVEFVKCEIGKDVNKGVNLDEVVVVGVVLQVGVLKGECKDVFFIDVILFSFGIEIKGGMMIKFIECNMVILIKCSEIFIMVDDNQLFVVIQVFQGECEFICDNKLFGMFELMGIVLVFCGILQIEVIFDIDVNGIVYVFVKDKGIGIEKLIVIFGGFLLLKEDIECMVCEVEEYVVEDKVCCEVVEVCNQVEMFVYLIDKFIIENDDKLFEDVKIEVKVDVDVFKMVLVGEDDEVVKIVFDKFNQLQFKFGEVIYVFLQVDFLIGLGIGFDGVDGEVLIGDVFFFDEDVIDVEVVDDEDEKK